MYSTFRASNTVLKLQAFRDQLYSQPYHLIKLFYDQKLNTHLQQTPLITITIVQFNLNCNTYLQSQSRLQRVCSIHLQQVRSFLIGSILILGRRLILSLILPRISTIPFTVFHSKHTQGRTFQLVFTSRNPPQLSLLAIQYSRGSRPLPTILISSWISTPLVSMLHQLLQRSRTLRYKI